MADRYFALTVLLDKNILSDDAEVIIKTVRRMKHVRAVMPHASNWTKAKKDRGELELTRLTYPGYSEEWEEQSEKMQI